MTRIKWLIMVFVISLLVGCGGGGGGGGGSISTTLIVKVEDAQTDAAISGASVTVTPTGGSPVNGATDALGQWNTTHYPAGKSTVSVTDPKNAYQPFQMNIDMPDGLSTYTVTLRLIPTGSTLPDTIDITPKEPKLEIGDKQQFTATITPSSGLKPTWTVFGSIGTISTSGLFTATSLGTGTVIVQIGNLYASTLVTVQESGVTPTTGNISGTVTDGSSTLPGVTITMGSSSTTSDSIGHYSFTGVAPGSHTISASKTGYGSASGNVTVAAGTTTTLNITMNPTAYTVRLGKDRTITSFNYHAWNFDTIAVLQASADGGSAQSTDATASVSESYGPGHAQGANARVGVDITWDLNGKTWAQVSNTPCSVTVTFDYSIQANYTDNAGYANSGVKTENFEGTGQWYDRIGTDVSVKGTRTKTAEVKTYQTTLAAIGNRISVLAYCNAMTKTSAVAGTINSSQAQVTIKSIQVHF